MASGTRGKTNKPDEKENEEKVLCSDFEMLESLIRSAIKNETASLVSKIEELATEIANLKTVNQKLVEQMNTSKQQQTEARTEHVYVDKAVTYAVRAKQNKQKESNNTTAAIPSTKQSGNSLTATPVAVNEHSTIRKKLAQSSNVGTYDHNTDPENDDFTVFHGRRKRVQRKNIIGTGEDSDELKGAAKKIWLFIGRVEPDTTEAQVIKYLKRKIPTGEFSCEKIPTRSENSCFKIGASYDYSENLNDPNFWPINTVVRRYLFRRNTPGQFATM